MLVYFNTEINIRNMLQALLSFLHGSVRQHGRLLRDRKMALDWGAHCPRRYPFFKLMLEVLRLCL